MFVQNHEFSVMILYIHRLINDALTFDLFSRCKFLAHYVLYIYIYIYLYNISVL